VICFLCVSLVTTPKRFTAVIGVIAASFGFHSAKAGLASLLAGGLRYWDGLAGAFVDNNGYALGTVMILPFLIAAAQNTEKRWIKLALLAAVPLSMFTVVSTFSRAGFLGMAVAMLLFVLLQRRRMLGLIAITLAGGVALAFVPIPRGYFDRVQTIGTYDEVQDESAISRLHFWQVALDMAQAEPLGIGLRNFESTYDKFDTSDGLYGPRRSVHSSHLEVLAENGILGAVVWVALFIYAFVLMRRVRKWSSHPGLSAEQSHFLFTMSNAMIVSMTGFLIGGAFIALSLNDLTWLTFSLVAALDRISVAMIAETRPVVVEAAPISAFGRAMAARTPSLAAARHVQSGRR
jgi:putative inorganic carbon (hco3(-)) transporter